MLRRRSIRTRLLVACALLVLTATIASVWTLAALSRLGDTVASVVRDSDQTTQAIAELAGALEREDDALLLALAGDARGSRILEEERTRTDRALSGLLALLDAQAHDRDAQVLRTDLDEYRRAADAVAATRGAPDALVRYHREANPALRRAITSTGVVRDRHFQEVRGATALARDEVWRARGVVFAIAVAALFASVLVALRLARVVIGPLAALRRSAIAIREGDLETRANIPSGDELGEVAAAFNEMAAHLAEFRRSKLSEVLRAKSALETTLAALPDAVVLLDADGTIATKNASADSLLRDAGIPAPRHAADLEAVGLDAARIAEALAGKQSQERLDLGAAVHVRRGEEERRLLPRVLHTRQVEEQPRQVVVVMSDVTELARLDEMRAELVAVASHELRTPLTTLRMTLLMLRENAASLPEAVRELVDTALIGVDQLGETVDELLDLTRIESGRLKLSCEPVRADLLVEEAVLRWEPRARDAGLTLALEVASALPPIACDRSRLRVVLDNLLDNALKYAPMGSNVSVALTAVRGTEPSRARVRITVVDHGPGVPEDLRERVFEKFFRVEHSRTRAGKEPRGSGIGLYLCRQLVELHGGAIRCESVPGYGGTQFAVELPALAAPATA